MAHVLHRAVAGLGWRQVRLARGDQPAGNSPAPRSGRSGQGSGQAGCCPGRVGNHRQNGGRPWQTALWVGPWPDSQSVAVSRRVVLAQVSTKISTTWSNSPSSDLQPEPGGGAAAEDKASSPSPWPDLPPTIPVNTASRS